jgi:hypothetical protein
MRIEMSSAPALFIFAHQDDEYGAFQAILDETRNGSSVHCAYLTDGSYGGCSPVRRNQESLRVLTDLGVPPANIVFAGHEHGIPDGRLPEHLEFCAGWLQAWLQPFSGITSIYVPAWEGGHQDHDALHAVVVGVSQSLGLLGRVWQFPLYNCKGCPGPLFRVFNPLAGNGPVTLSKITLRNRVRFLRYCLSYPSQRITWLGLFPFVMLHYITGGTQQLQRTSAAVIANRPHTEALYYEKRGYCSWNSMEASVSNMLDRI